MPSVRCIHALFQHLVAIMYTPYQYLGGHEQYTHEFQETLKVMSGMNLMCDCFVGFFRNAFIHENDCS